MTTKQEENDSLFWTTQSRVDRIGERFWESLQERADVVDVLHLRPFCDKRGWTFLSDKGGFSLGPPDNSRMDERFGTSILSKTPAKEDKELSALIELLEIRSELGRVRLHELINDYQPKANP